MASDIGWGRGGAGKASAGPKVEGANDVQRVESLAERINQLREKKQERPYKATLFALQEILTSKFWRSRSEIVTVRDSLPSR